MRQIHRLILLSALSSMALATPAFGTDITISNPVANDTIALGTNVGVTFVASGIGAAEERVGGIVLLVDGDRILSLGVVDGEVPEDPPNAAIPAPFEITWTPQEVGTFSLTARVFDINGTSTATSAAVSVTVSVGVAPDVPTIDSPASGSIILTNTTITIEATATDSDGVITQVEFFVNGQSKGVDDNFPYSFEFLLPAPDTYLLDVVATDNTGFTTPSATTTITAIAGASPSVSITSPSTSTLSPNTEITITADAADSDGLIEQVEFFVNGASLGPADTSFPYNIAFIVPSPGSYAITAVATDNSGNATTSATVTITSATPGGGIGTSPTVSITSPEDGSSFTPGTIITISADAFDSDGLIDKVEFFVNGSSVGTSLSFPFSISYTLPSPGSYAITAVATDNSESSTTSSEVAIISANVGGGEASPPTVSILSPPDGVSFIPGSTLTLAAIASDPDGLVETVEFFVNGVSVEIVRSAPFQTQFSLPTTGTFVITAVATDNSDNIGTSPAVTVTAGPADNETPRVVIDHPLPVGGGDTINDVSVASSMYLNATAIDPDGEIKEVRFFANNLLLGTVTQGLGDRYALFFDPITRGDYVFFAEAEDFDGNVGQSVFLTLEVGPFKSLFPEVELTLVSPIDPKVRVEDKVVFKVTVTETLTSGVGFSLVTFYADGVYIGIANPDTGSDTATFAWFPDIVGNFDITARVIQLDPNGFTFDNWIITDPVALSVIAVSENRLLLEQTVEDLLNDELTQEEADALVAELDSGQTNFSQAIEEIFQSDDSAVVQEALMARFLLSGAWPNHDLLFQDKSTIEQDGLSRLVEILIPAFQAVYWNNQNLPDAFSSDAERTDFIEILFNNKYGVAPNQDQINAILTRMVFLGSNRFIELFIQDNTVISFADGTLSQFLAIPNPPNDRLPRLADAASLLINLLRIEPSASVVSALEQQERFIDQVETVLNDPRFDDRFGSLSVPSQIVSGSGDLMSEDNIHESGNVFDEIIMSGPSITVQSRPDIISRIYFLDEDGDIVVAEFAGSGVLKITLDPATYIPPSTAVKYNMPDVKYVTGRASFQIAESADDTWFAVYTWGELNIPNADWLKSGINYDGVADVAFLSVTGESMAGILAGNAIFSSDKNIVGIHAPNVRITTLVVIRDIDAIGAAVPYLQIGSNSDIDRIFVAGGDLRQSNGSAINVRLDSAYQGFDIISTVEGINSNGLLVPRRPVSVTFTTGAGNIFIRLE